MNHCYKLKFNRRTRSLDAVAEISTSASAQGKTSTHKSLLNFSLVKKALSGLTLAFLGANLISPSFATTRTGMNVVHGQVQTLVTDAVTSYQTTPNTIIEWQKFNINSHEIVQFLQESANSAVLNRILGGEVSQILGTLQSNGKVFLVNPAGVVFGENAKVEVGSLVASTLDLTNEDFLNGQYVFNQEKDKALASIINQGMIKVQEDGTLALVGGQVVNTGVLEARNGTVYLLAGQAITIQDLSNPLISYKVTADNQAVNLGAIFAKNVALLGHQVAHGTSFADLLTPASQTKASINANGEVMLYAGSVAEQGQTTADAHNFVTPAADKAGLVVQAGVIAGNQDSTSFSHQGQARAGKVSVLADHVVLTNQAQVTATQVNVGGDLKGKGTVKLASTTLVAEQAVVDVSAANGDAGQAIVWGDLNQVKGTFIATAANGKGGFVETSGKTLDLANSFDVDTRGSAGKGEWLLDPENLHIVNATTYATKTAATDEQVSDLSPTSNQVTYKTASSDNTKTDSYLLDNKVEELLKSNNVTLEATNNLSVTGANIDTEQYSQEDYGVVSKANGWLTLTANNVSFDNSTVKTRSVAANATNNITVNNSTINTTVHLDLIAGNQVLTGGDKNILDAYAVNITANGTLHLKNVTMNTGTYTPAGVTNVTSIRFNSKDDLILENITAKSDFGQVRITTSGDGKTLHVLNSTLTNNWQEVMTHAIGKGGEVKVEGSVFDALVDYYIKGGKVTLKDSKFSNQRETEKANQSTIALNGNGDAFLENVTLCSTSKLQFQAKKGDNGKRGNFTITNSTLHAQGIETFEGNLQGLFVTNSTITSNTGLQLNVEDNVSFKGVDVTGNNIRLRSTSGSFTADADETGKVSKIRSRATYLNISAGKDITLGQVEASAGQNGQAAVLNLKADKVKTSTEADKVAKLKGRSLKVEATNEVALDHVDISVTSDATLKSTSSTVTLTNAKVKADTLTASTDSNAKITIDSTDLDVSKKVQLDSSKTEFKNNTGSGADKAQTTDGTTIQNTQESDTTPEVAAQASSDDNSGTTTESTSGTTSEATSSTTESEETSTGAAESPTTETSTVETVDSDSNSAQETPAAGSETGSAQNNESQDQASTSQPESSASQPEGSSSAQPEESEVKTEGSSPQTEPQTESQTSPAAGTEETGATGATGETGETESTGDQSATTNTEETNADSPKVNSPKEEVTEQGEQEGQEGQTGAETPAEAETPTATENKAPEAEVEDAKKSEEKEESKDSEAPKGEEPTKGTEEIVEANSEENKEAGENNASDATDASDSSETTETVTDAGQPTTPPVETEEVEKEEEKEQVEENKGQQDPETTTSTTVTEEQQEETQQEDHSAEEATQGSAQEEPKADSQESAKPAEEKSEEAEEEKVTEPSTTPEAVDPAPQTPAPVEPEAKEPEVSESDSTTAPAAEDQSSVGDGEKPADTSAPAPNPTPEDLPKASTEESKPNTPTADVNREEWAQPSEDRPLEEKTPSPSGETGTSTNVEAEVQHSDEEKVKESTETDNPGTDQDEQDTGTVGQVDEEGQQEDSEPKAPEASDTNSEAKPPVPEEKEETSPVVETEKSESTSPEPEAPKTEAPETPELPTAPEVPAEPVTPVEPAQPKDLPKEKPEAALPEAKPQDPQPDVEKPQAEQPQPEQPQGGDTSPVQPTPPSPPASADNANTPLVPLVPATKSEPREPTSTIPLSIRAQTVISQEVNDKGDHELKRLIFIAPEQQPLPQNSGPQEAPPVILKAESFQKLNSCKVGASGSQHLGGLGVSAGDISTLSLGEIASKYNLSASDLAGASSDCQ